MKKALAGALAVSLCSSVTIVLAQTAPGAPGTDQVIPEKKGAPIAPSTSVSGSEPALSDKLKETNGVIKPSTNVDPGMSKDAPVPNPNSMPVIKPPGTPGGPAGAEPK
jgi:hypothetical protein